MNNWALLKSQNKRHLEKFEQKIVTVIQISNEYSLSKYLKGVRGDVRQLRLHVVD